LIEVADPNAAEKAAQDMIYYAPRRVTLAPHEPQSIRIAARAPEGLADGEYRVHLLFRAVPPPVPARAPGEEAPQGVQIKLIPVYGVTIPVIVRLGNLSAQAAIANVHLEQNAGRPEIALDLSREGSRSTFGEVRVLKSGVKNPIAVRKSIAVYTEIKDRKVTVPIDDAYHGPVSGPVTVQYLETADDGSQKLAEVQAVLR
jgi:P pilus assembly chaperone PapD